MSVHARVVRRRHVALGAVFVVVVLAGAYAFGPGARASMRALSVAGGGPSDSSVSRVISPKLPDGSQRAFPTAEGFGATARGGRGGAILFVTNTNDEGPGTLRACIEAEGPRTCVFRVSGTITLEKQSLVVKHPYLTIAGETAPGDGIAIRNSPTQIRPSIELITQDVIIRHLRLRPGPHTVEACCSGALGFYGKAARNIIIDHVSASWGSDETVDSEDASFFTVQWSFITEPLVNGGPGKHGRARNMLFTKGGNISVHHNLFALGRFRNPQIQPGLKSGIADVVNNVLYSPVWDYVVSFSDRWAPVKANVIGNYKAAGKSDKSDRLVHLFEDGDHGFSVFLGGNIDETYRATDSVDEAEALGEPFRKYVSDEPFKVPGVTTMAASDAYDAVLLGSGATKPVRDEVDARIVDQVRNKTGVLLKSDPTKVGGWPVLRSAPPPADLDADGMADAWEMSVGLDPSSKADGNQDLDGDGWTNFEEYLHELAGDGEGMARLETGHRSAL
jgi:pectate lyase